MNKLSESIDLFLHAPVLSLNNKLIPLSGDVLINGQGVNIGFNMNPCNMLPIPAELYGKTKLFEGNSFAITDGSALKVCKSPVHSDLYDNAYEEKPMPLYSIIDFNATPVRCCASTMLQNYISSHLGFEDSNDRKDPIENATKIHKLNKSLLEPEKIPMQMCAWSLQCIFYLQKEAYGNTRVISWC